MDLLKRLEREWGKALRDKPKFMDLAIIIRLFSDNCDEPHWNKLKKYIEYLESQINNIPLTQLSQVVAALKHAKKRLNRSTAGTNPGGGALNARISAPDRRRATRTLNHSMVKALRAHQLANPDLSDSLNEPSDDELDTE